MFTLSRISKGRKYLIPNKLERNDFHSLFDSVAFDKCCLTVIGACYWVCNWTFFFSNFASVIGTSIVILFEGVTFGIQFEYLPCCGYHQPSGDFRQNRHNRQNCQSPRGQGVFRHYHQPSGNFCKNRQFRQGATLASNLDRLRLAFFRHCMHQPSGEFCQNHQFCHNRQSSKGIFWHSIEIVKGWLFFAISAIFAIARISGHKWSPESRKGMKEKKFKFDLLHTICLLYTQ